MSRFPKVFSEVYISVVRVGEESGNLSQVMNDLADQLEANDEFKRKVKGALIYPKIVFITMLVFVAVLCFIVC